MSIRSRLKSLITYRFSSRDNPVKLGGSYLMPISGRNTTANSLDYLDAYVHCPEVNAVIGRKARMFSKGQIRVVSKSTGGDAKNYEFLIKVIRNPNWFQAQREFVNQTKTFHEIFGNEYLFFDKPYGMPYKSVRNLYTLPPHLTTSETPQDKPFFMYGEPVIKYKFKWNNEVYDLDEGAVIQFNDNRVDMNPKNWVNGTSKLEALRTPINNIMAAYESRNVIIHNRGAAGFITPDAKDLAGVTPFDGKDAEQLQDKFRDYGTLANQFQFIITPSPMRFESIGTNNPVNLGLFQETEADFQKICDQYGMDRDLFSNEKGATFENKKQGERSTYNNTIIPEFTEWVEGLNDIFTTKQDGWMLVADFSSVPVLQENLDERGRALKSAVEALSMALQTGGITPEQYIKELAKLGIGI